MMPEEEFHHLADETIHNLQEKLEVFFFFNQHVFPELSTSYKVPN
jgi:hypothetical protein